MAKLYDPNSEIVAKILTTVYYVASQQFSQCPKTPWPCSYGSGFLPKRLHFHVHVLGFCLLFLLYLFHNNQSVTFLSFPKTGRTVSCLCLVSAHNGVLFIYTNVIPLFHGLILFCLHRGWDNESQKCLLLFANKFFETTLFICLFVYQLSFQGCTIMRMLLVIKAC
jgi:hypothetical protein